jgi:hypothetical protein
MNTGIRPDSSFRGTGNKCSKSRNPTEDSPLQTYLGSSLQDLQGTVTHASTVPRQIKVTAELSPTFKQLESDFVVL